MTFTLSKANTFARILIVLFVMCIPVGVHAASFLWWVSSPGTLTGNGSTRATFTSYQAPGSPIDITWDMLTIYESSTHCYPIGWTGGWAGISGGAIVSPIVPTTYQVDCTVPYATSAITHKLDVVFSSLPPPVPTASLTAIPSTISSGGTTGLTYSCTNATSATISSYGAVNPSGSGPIVVSPSGTTTYTLTCTNSSGSATANATVTVSSSPVASLIANPTTIVSGGSSGLTYSCSSGSTAASIDQGVGSVDPSTSGPVSVSPTNTSTYTLTCTNAVGTGTASVTITVVPTLTASCSVSPASISAGSSATWTAVAAGGTGAYSYSWSGTDGLTGVTNPLVFPYVSAGSPKSASVTVTSGTQTITRACSNTLTVNPAPTPNLTVTQAPSGSTSFTASTPTTFSGSTLNNGSGIATNYPNVLQVLDQAGTVSVARYAAVPATVTTVAAGSSAVTGTIPGNALPPATYKVRFCANMDTTGALVISESNPADNCGPTTTITVASSGSPATACSVSQTSLSSAGGTVTYSANPSGGATSPYTWTSSDGLGGPFGSGASATRTFTSANQGSSYGMTVSASPSGTSNCPNVTVGSVCSGTPTGTITATPNRVKSGSSVQLAITAVQHVQNFCYVTGTNGYRSADIPANACTTAAAAPLVTIPTITTQTTFRLICDGTKISEVIVNILPNFREF